MNRHAQHFNSGLCVLSAATLLVWIAALILCTAHCSFGMSHGAAKSACCKAEGKKPSGKNEPASNLSCLTFKSALVSDYSSVAFGIESSHLYDLSNFSAVLNTAFLKPTPLSLRQSWQRKLSFTPAVCLKSANQSHAPPALA